MTNLVYRIDQSSDFLEQLNQSVFLQINADLTTSNWQLNLAIFIAEYLILAIPLLLIILWCWGNTVQRNLALKACAVALIALGMNQLIIMYWPHPRPFMIGLGHSFIPHAADASFPSDHGTAFASIGLTFLFSSLRSATGWIILAMGALVAWSRIFLGVHFPLDMLGAVLVSCIAWLGLTFLWNKMGDAITKWCEKIYRVLFAQPIARGWIRR
ncbi:phosphatase PAP2 family protein [Undibacterium sp. Jales W-56]|uniref:phosphatase PAP2 family protein n=1 Tax=Undibacterium sp. Jales W-56 TaxID=2897325 RepID=UPI0021D12526|nr:phosphatase PAP2 family protein [Undibacterium sp. Jales W-56]MCU6433858.1 phosphatase PAP2 family protein [Undibacterium sp. Jales W-56]